MSSIVLEVELLPGTDIKQAATDVVEYSKETNKMVTAPFNGFQLIASVDKPAEMIINEYYSWVKWRDHQ